MKSSENKSTKQSFSRLLTYLNFLKDVHLLLKASSNMNMTKLIKEHGLPTHVSTALQALSIVEKKNDGRWAEWYWNEEMGSPGFPMANKVMQMTEKEHPIEDMSKQEGREFEANGGIIKAMQEIGDKEKGESAIKYSYIHLLWGLVKIKITHHK